MTLDKWINQQAKARNVSRQVVMRDLAGAAKVNFATVSNSARGALMGRYDKARSIAEATSWEVSVIELCDPDPGSMLAKIREANHG